MSLLERVYAFHQDIIRERYPNATTLSEQFEISPATARRDIAYLRDRLLAPLAFDTRKNGFYYTEDGFSLPFTESPKITLLLGMLNKFGQEAGLSRLPEIQQLEKKLSQMLSADHTSLIDCLYCEWIEVESIDTDVFGTIVEAVVNRRSILLSYATTGGQSSSRHIEPQRICNYQGRWYLLAFCRLRQDLRMFHIARIQEAQLTKESIRIIPGLTQEYLEPSFGIFKGKKTERARLRFTGTAAELVRHQHWHRDQQISVIDDGILLELPISDDREITMKVLQYGSMVQVEGPPRLKKRIAEEIRAMSTLYREE